MGFMLRIILGLSLVLVSCAITESASSWRHIRQALPEEVPEVSVSVDKLNITKPKKEETVNDIINKTTTNNDPVLLDNKPKTENETEKEDKYTNNLKLNKEVEYEYSGEDVPETSQKTDDTQVTTKEPDTKLTASSREESARSVDIDKYISPNFHDRNHVYNLATSPDTERYSNLHEEFSRTTVRDFDKKQKDIKKDVDDKLEYIDSEFTQEQKRFPNEYIGENLNISEILENSRDNDTNTELRYIKHKDITSNYNKVKNRVNKETDIETGQSINLSTSYNETHIYDDTPKDYKNKISTHDEEFDTKFTHKLITESIDVKKLNADKSSDNVKEVLNQKDTTPVTKPPPINKTLNQDHLFSNKIETDATNLENDLKSNFLYTSSRLPVLLPTTVASTTKAATWSHVFTTANNSQNEKITTIALTKRGSTKYFDTVSSGTSTTSIPRTVKPTVSKKQNLANNENHGFEEVVQENQVYPVQVAAPSTDQTMAAEDTTIVEHTASTFFSETTSKMDFTSLETTLDGFEFTTGITDPTTAVGEETAYEVTPNNNSVTFTDPELSTVSTLEAITETIEMNSTIEVNDTIDVSTQMNTEINIFNNGREFEFSTVKTDTTESITVTTKHILSQTTTSQKILTTSEFYNATTTENIPTTSDYRDNIIFKQSDSPNTNKPTDTSVPIEKEKSIANETKNFENKTNELKASTRIHTRTTESSLIIPLNISMYETEPEMTTNGHFIDSSDESNSGKIAAIVISSIGAVCLILLAGLLFVMRKRHKRFNYGQRCTPVSLDAYSVDNVSVYNSMRRKGALRASKRSYGNPAFDDPTSTSNPLNFPSLAKFSSNSNAIASEFDDVPQVTAQTNELPEGCETKNRYANVIPLPESRVFLNPIEGYPNSDYINANYVTGPKSTKNYYIACQAPMQNTVEDFWRMVWEQQSKVILMLTHLFENGSEKCVDYLPPSEVLDCHRLFGDYQITLKKREVKEKYVISILQLKNMVSNSWREVTHLWYLGWPEKGVPSETNSLIAFLIEARSYIKALPAAENGKSNNSAHEKTFNGSSNNRHNPIVVHCSPGTGRTGTVIACDIAIREFELTRQIDIPKTVYRIRRDRASSVQTKDQYAFIYNVITLYATKLTGGVLDSF